MYYGTDKLLEASQYAYDPVLALVANKDNEGDYYIESHRIDAQGCMLEGVPLSKECITDLVGGFSAEYSNIPFGMIPPNLLHADNRVGHNKYIWYNPPRQRMMYFRQDLNIENDFYYVPGVVYVVDNNSLNIYAFKGKKPVNQLYKAPFFNVTGASVCLGNAKLDYPEEPSFSDILEYWEKKFWLSEFSYLGGNSNPTQNNLYLSTKKWKEQFDYTELILSNTTLKSLLK